MVNNSTTGANIMAKGRLSNTEKYAIQGMLHSQKTIDEIAQILGRSEPTVKKYVDGELDSIHNDIAKIQAESVEDEPIVKTSPDPTIVQKAINQLKDSGLDHGMAIELCERAIKKHGNPPNSDTLQAWAVNGILAKDLMGHRTAGKGENTVSVMTGAASSKTDKSRDAMPESTSRTARNNLYHIREDEVR